MDEKTAALEFVNEIRAKYELPLIAELPRGMRYHPNECPIGRGCAGQTAEGRRLAACVGVEGAWILSPEFRAPSGPTKPNFTQRKIEDFYPRSFEVAEFMRAFDRGEYPELIA